jgi:hypothetical protein
MRNLKMAESIFPVSVRSFTLDWPSSVPLHYTMTLDGLAAPSDFITRETGLKLPNLPVVEVSIRTEEEGDATGRASIVHDIYHVKDLFNFDARAKFVWLGDAGGKSMPFGPTWQFSRMWDAAIAGLDLKLEDKNLMAYVLLNVEGSRATGDSLAGYLSLWPSASTENKKMRDSLAMFIKQPGTLSVHFAPESPVPFSRWVQEVLRDPSAFLTIDGTPGPMPVRDMVKKIQEPAGK